MSTNLQPLYVAEELNAAFHLRYTWSGRLKFGLIPNNIEEVLTQIAPKWETDGIRLMEHEWNSAMVQATFSVEPHISPTQFCQRIKGRLQHALRQLNWHGAFKRNFGFRSIGHNRSSDILQYLDHQVENGRFADPRFEALLSQFTSRDESVDFATPVSSSHGRYWYNLHLVLVTNDQLKFADEDTLRTIFDTCERIAHAKTLGLASRSLMPDHLHVALKGNIHLSPEDTALTFLNNIAYAVGQKRIWRPSYYVGTFSEYNMNAVRS